MKYIIIILILQIGCGDKNNVMSASDIINATTIDGVYRIANYFKGTNQPSLSIVTYKKGLRLIENNHLDNEQIIDKAFLNKNIAECYWNMGYRKAALNYINKALIIEPNSEILPQYKDTYLQGYKKIKPFVYDW